MSRRASRARRKARKVRAPSQRFTPRAPYREPWGSVPGRLTPEQESRVLQRFSNMRFRNFTVSFVPVFDTWFEAKTPEELIEAVRQKLIADFKGKPQN
jgi:hypothetical protein